MSQTFNLHLATHALSNDAKRLGVRPGQLRQIHINVSAKITQQPEPQLSLTYQIQLPSAELAAQLQWPAWTQSHVHFTDYLWEQTCLECFIAAESTTTYVEINASPNGRYALYQFSNYRDPSTLPPLPLLKADKEAHADIYWPAQQSVLQVALITTLSPANKLKTADLDLIAHTFIPPYRYQRQFGVPLAQLPTSLSNQDNHNPVVIEWLHPCVILWFGEVALYFAPTHASPPDFHQRRYWTRFNA